MLFVPTLFPFNFHWYDGVPPLTGVAVNVTLVPAHIVADDAAMLTDGATVLVTVMLIVFDVAVVGLAQPSDEVITTLTWSLFARALLL